MTQNAESWQADAAKMIDGMDDECRTHEGRKAFHAGDGVQRAKVMITQLDALRARLHKFISA